MNSKMKRQVALNVLKFTKFVLTEMGYNCFLLAIPKKNKDHRVLAAAYTDTDVEILQDVIRDEILHEETERYEFPEDDPCEEEPVETDEPHEEEPVDQDELMAAIQREKDKNMDAEYKEFKEEGK